MTGNTRTNELIKWLIILADFIVLNIVLFAFIEWHPGFERWIPYRIRIFILLSNLALLISEYYNPPLIHERMVSVSDILQRLFRLSLVQAGVAIVVMKLLDIDFASGTIQLLMGLVFFLCEAVARYVERKIIKFYRQAGRNTRYVTFVGSDSELLNIYHRLYDEAAKGYLIYGYYADEEMKNVPEDVKLERLGTLQEFLKGIDQAERPEELKVGDEIYVSVSRTERETVRRISRFCDRHVVRFYFVPVSVESLGIDLKREMLDDIEVYTTYENPLANPVNKLIKRTFDIVMSVVALLVTLPFLPIIWIIIKIQSPGPLLFKQERTGVDGKSFNMLKFRSMHVNADADRLQATKDDPRKYPFGNFMRKANVDELPQFLNVLKGDMSIVGPRPHMLAHTQQYSELIDKYMVRHFVKPGVTGWAQVTGFRGETKELWQMEGRVKRDIWYIEHWSIWLDIRIMWMTVKSMVVHDKNAY